MRNIYIYIYISHALA